MIWPNDPSLDETLFAAFVKAFTGIAALPGGAIGGLG
jgi:hypothetical protein